MKKILLLHSSSELYGSDKSFLTICTFLNKTKYKLYVVLPTIGPLYYKIKDLDNIDVFIHQIAVLRRKNFTIKGIYRFFIEYLNANKFLKKFIKDKNIDLVYLNSIVLIFASIITRKSKVKNILHVREIISNKIENRVLSYFANKNTDYVIANSQSTGSSLLIKNSKLRVIYNSIEEQESTENEKSQFIVGMASRINRWKGQNLFVDASKIVIDKYPDIKFLIAGDSYQDEEYIKNDLIKYIDQKKLSNNVKCIGNITNINSFYNKISIFVLPSIKPEPFGLVVLEAMEHKIPVIATNHGGPTEIIADGVNGFLVDFNECNEMAERIIELYEDKKKLLEIGNKGFLHKRETFSISNMINSIEQVLDETLKF